MGLGRQGQCQEKQGDGSRYGHSRFVAPANSRRPTTGLADRIFTRASSDRPPRLGSRVHSEQQALGLISPAVSPGDDLSTKLQSFLPTPKWEHLLQLKPGRFSAYPSWILVKIESQGTSIFSFSGSPWE